MVPKARQGTPWLSAKLSSFKNPHIKIDLLVGAKILKLQYSIMNLNTTSLPWWVRPTNKQPLFIDVLM